MGLLGGKRLCEYEKTRVWKKVFQQLLKDRSTKPIQSGTVYQLVALGTMSIGYFFSLVGYIEDKTSPASEREFERSFGGRR